MDRAAWKRVETLFGDVVDAPTAADREKLLRRHEHDEPVVVAEVRRLLDSHLTDPGFLETQVVPLESVMLPDGASDETHRVGPYRLIRPLGSGGMGEVFLAEREADDFSLTFALKIIAPGRGTHEILRRFRLEQHILSQLKHPGIASLVDGGATSAGRPYFVMEYVEGSPIDAYVDGRGLEVEDVLELFIRVAEAVQYAHQNLVVHRDLKPSNILVTADGDPKLLDFGISKLLESDDASPTLTQARMLTPEYAAPEQILGLPVTPASDVFALGVLLHRLLTGLHPFKPEAATSGMLVETIVHGDRVRPSERAPESRARRLRGDLDTIILKALRPESERRYPTASALAADLRRHLDGRPVLARPDTIGYRTGKFIRRNGLPLSAAGAVLAGLVAFGLYASAQANRFETERDRALEVRSFLLETFGAADPDRASTDPVTAGELLDGQAAQLDQAYADRPRLEAEMASVLAEGYERLGQFDRAVTMGERALILLRDSLDAPQAEVARAEAFLGYVVFRNGDPDGGEERLRSALAVQRDLPDEREAMSRTLNDLGVLLERRGDYEEAGLAYTEALEIRRATAGERHRVTAITASNLSVIHYRLGDFGEARRIATLALDAMRASLGEDHQRSIIIQNNLAAIAIAQGDVEGAEEVYEDLVARQTRVQGEAHPVTLTARDALSDALIRQGKLEDADRVLVRTLELKREAYGDEAPELSTTYRRLGTVRVQQERYEEAMALHRQAVELARGISDGPHVEVAGALTILAETHERMGDLDTAVRLTREALVEHAQAMGEQHPGSASLRMQLGHRQLRRGDAGAAYEEFTIVLPLLESLLEPATPNLLSTRLRLAHAALLTGRTDEARRRLEESESAFTAETPAPLRSLADSLQQALEEPPTGGGE